MLNLRGAFTAMVTPFRDGKVDESRLREQIEFQINSGIDGLVPVGTTGESPTLDFPEHERVIELTVQIANSRVPVIAGTGGNATTEALELHTFAKKVGCDAGLSVNPYYNKPTQEGLYRHFMTLADKVDLPIVLYNIPGRTGITMSPQTVARLCEASQHRRDQGSHRVARHGQRDHVALRYPDPQRRRFADAAADEHRRQGRDLRRVESGPAQIKRW